MSQASCGAHSLRALGLRSVAVAGAQANPPVPWKCPELKTKPKPGPSLVSVWSCPQLVSTMQHYGPPKGAAKGPPWDPASWLQPSKHKTVAACLAHHGHRQASVTLQISPWALWGLQMSGLREPLC